MDDTKEKQRSRGEKMFDFLRGRGSKEAAESDTAKREKDALRGREKQMRDLGLACGGKVKKYAKGGEVQEKSKGATQGRSELEKRVGFLASAADNLEESKRDLAPSRNRPTNNQVLGKMGKPGFGISRKQAKAESEARDHILNMKEERLEDARKRFQQSKDEMAKPAKYAEGGSVRGYGAARGAKKACKTY